MSQPSPATSDKGLPITSSYLLEHSIPAGIWLVFLLAKTTLLLQYLAAIAAGQITFATGLYVVQQTLTIAFTVLIIILFMARRPVIGRRAPWPSRVLAIVGTFVLIAPGAYQVGDDQPERLIVSSALITIGLVISIVSLRTLDRCFGLFPEVRGLVTTGPYRYVRHPLYLGEIVTGLGIVVGAGRLPPVGLFVILCVCQYWRAQLEEKALVEAFPTYAAYQQHTWRIIPLIH